MVTDAELLFWIACGLLALVFTLTAPLIYNYMEYQRIHSMFNNR